MIVHNVKIAASASERVLDREKKRIYVGCAESDTQYRDMLVFGRHRWELYSKPRIDFITLDRREMALDYYMPIVEKAIREADGVMIMVSAQTAEDPLAIWEIECSLSNNIPIVGVDVRHASEGNIPPRLAENLIKFGWEWFAEFFNNL